MNSIITISFEGVDSMRWDFLMTTTLFAMGAFLFTAAVFIFSRKEQILGIRLVGALAAMNSVFMFGYAGFLLSDHIATKIWLNHVQYLAIPFFAALWYLLSRLQKTGVHRFGWKAYIWILAIPTLAMIANLLYPATEVPGGTWINHLLFVSHEITYDADFGTGFVGLVFEKGVLYYLLMGYSSLMAVFSFVNYALLSKKAEGMGRKRVIILAGASVVAFLATLIPLFSPWTALIDGMPFFTGLFSFLTFLLLFKYELFELIPQAYRMIFYENNSPILILDRTYKVISANRVAKEFFRDLHPNLERAPLSSFQMFDPEMLECVRERKSHEWKFPNSSPERHYLVKVMEIAKNGGKATGYTIYYEDITAHKNQLKRMEYFALYDDLTRIRNRRYFFQLAVEAFDKAIEKREKIAVIMFDLDDFKEVNDIYGHQAGDSVLHDLAALISQELDSEALFARYGGEEFIIFQKDTSLEDAAKLARRLCAVLNGHVFAYEKRMIKTTASFGVSGSKKQIDRSLDNYIKQADDALYQAKTQGKNQVFVHSESNL